MGDVELPLVDAMVQVAGAPSSVPVTVKVWATSHVALAWGVALKVFWTW